MNQANGTLYGIGVGPGDPDLIPVKAVKILNKVDLIFAASSTKNLHSRAVEIVRPHLPETARVHMLSFPMTKDPVQKQESWRRHARTIIGELRRGRNAAFITLGDCLTYATYGYILQAIREISPATRVITIPGITSYQAAAARINLPLVEGEQSLLVVSGAEGGDNLRRACACAENVVILKAYRNTTDILAALEEAEMLPASVAISNLGMADEKVIQDVRELAELRPGYWTLVIAKK